MKKIVSALALTAVTATSAFAHGGGLNSQGCHNKTSDGTYHCHRQQSKASVDTTTNKRAHSLPKQTCTITDSTMRNWTGLQFSIHADKEGVWMKDWQGGSAFIPHFGQNGQGSFVKQNNSHFLEVANNKKRTGIKFNKKTKSATLKWQGFGNHLITAQCKGQTTYYKKVVKADPNVRLAQKFLNNKGYNLSVDGVWGKNTKRAITNYFAQHNQVFDGNFDYKDLHAMYAMKKVVVQQPTITIKVISTTVEKPKVYEYLFESHIMTAERLLKTCKLIKNRNVSKEDKEVLTTYAKVKDICGY